MPKSKTQKNDIIKNLTDKIGQAKSIVFVKYDGLGVKENEALRRALAEENSEYLVAKKTLLDLAFEKAKFAGLKISEMTGQLAAVFGFGTEEAAAKIIHKFQKDHEGKIAFAGAILENKFIDAVAAEEFAKLPTRKELYAKLVGSINAPVAGFVNTLAGVPRNFLQVLSAIGEKK
jgi:large subunit ribosomal protein L10